MGSAQVSRRHAACLGHAREIGSMTRTAVLCSLKILVPAQVPPPERTHRKSDSQSTTHTPVVIVPGFGGNRSSWWPLEQGLQAAGYFNRHAVLYDPARMDLTQIAKRLVIQCHRAMHLAGTRRVHVLGHSLGGVVLRYAVQQLGLAEHIGVAVTVASPHRGTAVARLGHGPVATDLRPDSALLTRLNTQCRPDGVNWVSYWSDADIVVHPSSARLEHPALSVMHMIVPGAGHVSILRSPVLIQSTLDQLALADAGATARALAG